MRRSQRGAGLGKPVAINNDAGRAVGRVAVGSNEWRARHWSRETPERTERSTTICATFVEQQQEDAVRVRQCPSDPAGPGVGTVGRRGRALGGIASDSEWQQSSGRGGSGAAGGSQ
ncbi:hypothetical protein AB1L88_24845 [Tautonia sp. JC769]|uniref:hypothetical protein n=1 Tax=Tautonia sp. JC769 TaxID=3232135 RepID=UPI00345774B5